MASDGRQPEESRPTDEPDGPSPDGEGPDAAPREGARSGDEPPRLVITIPPFDPRVFRRRMAIDTSVRWGMLAALIVVVTSTSVYEAQGGSPIGASLPLLLILGGWIAISMTTARAAQELQTITALIERDTIEAESRLAATIARVPLHRSVRLLTVHRLATLRHRQGRLAETAAICERLLDERLEGPAKRVRPHLLLILTDAYLTMGQLPAAWSSLHDLHATPMGLSESLQRHVLRTRYLTAIGSFNGALADVGRQLELTQIMPHAQSAAMHRLLAQAAQQTGRTDLATWIDARGELMFGDHYAAGASSTPLPMITEDDVAFAADARIN